MAAKNSEIVCIFNTLGLVKTEWQTITTSQCQGDCQNCQRALDSKLIKTANKRGNK